MPGTSMGVTQGLSGTETLPMDVQVRGLKTCPKSCGQEQMSEVLQNGQPAFLSLDFILVSKPKNASQLPSMDMPPSSVPGDIQGSHASWLQQCEPRY